MDIGPPLPNGVDCQMEEIALCRSSELLAQCKVTKLVHWNADGKSWKTMLNLEIKKYLQNVPSILIKSKKCECHKL